jgi:NOL1/NOP2/sun family putative RNA methylase
MTKLRLPQPFLDKMKLLLDDEYDDWLASYEEERWYGLRVNTLKVSADEYMAMTPWAARLTPIPWAASAFYYDQEARPGKHPHYHAGLYYMQEPSAMVPAELLDVQPGHRVLDLCAAPGGKSTQLGAKLQGEGLLVSNDNAGERTKALARNIELAGIRNAIVLNEEPAALAARFPSYFDRVLVDAPCSGEGMFRKDESMIDQWAKHSVQRCAGMQRVILQHAAEMVAPGGMLVYSTCTFSPEENEAQIAELLAARPDYAVVPIEPAHGWAAGLPAGNETLTGTVRLWPHRVQGEGHYAAVLRREATPTADERGSQPHRSYDADEVYKQLAAGRAPHKRADKDKRHERPQKREGSDRRGGGASVPEGDEAIAMWRKYAAEANPRRCGMERGAVGIRCARLSAAGRRTLAGRAARRPCGLVSRRGRRDSVRAVPAARDGAGEGRHVAGVESSR